MLVSVFVSVSVLVLVLVPVLVLVLVLVLAVVLRLTGVVPVPPVCVGGVGVTTVALGAVEPNFTFILTAFCVCCPAPSALA